MVNDGHSNDGHKELMRATNDDSDGLNNDGQPYKVNAFSSD